MQEPKTIPHPGERIRAEVIPAGMSVTKAAQIIGVGRPALSNLLNGKASLSTDMAKRLEKSFNYPSKDLLEMQALYDEQHASSKGAPANTKAFVPPFLSIKANDIEQWSSNNIQARAKLSVLLRTLTHSTNNEITRVDFPGNDDSERPGWDGIVEAKHGSPWIPQGNSGWEFGTNNDVKKKANKDFDKSVKAIENKERANTTFVFVTPRRWPGKTDWVTEKRSTGLWKDIRAYDASDLEQWLEQSLPAQAWFANETNLPTKNVRSLDKCWSDWANVSSPPLAEALFKSAIDSAKRTMLSRLSKPVDSPTIISADSTEEALAFLAQLLSEHGGEELASYRDQVLVFDKTGTLPRLAEGAQTFIPVAYSREVERELAPFATSMHSIVIYPRNATNADPHIVLEPASYDTFNQALEEMGKGRDEVTKLANESGRSLTVLRRRLANVPAVRTPEWSEDHVTATRLVPFLLVGAWNSTNEADQLALELLSESHSYPELEKELQDLAQLNDTPVWSIGIYRGVISKIDLLYAIANIITPEDLNRYFDIARLVLGEDDPALDLAEDQRWAASLHNKTREFSGAFREGISETLVLLSVHGKHLFKNRLGIDTEVESLKVVRDLLPAPLTTRILEANDRDLPTYAEAAPHEFLSTLERDLRTDNPAVFGLLRPVSPGPFSHPSRTGLLWALEGLSWNPVTLPRAARILARLAQVEINDNWTNKPINSLESIFRAWMPQTSASHETRISLMHNLAMSFPDIAWKLCIAQFENHSQIGNYSHKPKWRSDGYGFGEPFQTRQPIIAFVREMIDMALTWEEYSLSMLCELVERLHILSNSDQDRIWSLIKTWARDQASDAEKATLREKIRMSTLSRRAALRAKKRSNSVNLAIAAKNIYAELEPSDLLSRHAWLFCETWVEESADEIEEIETVDFDKREERIHKLRVEALREIYHDRGITGLLDIARQGKASWIIGRLAATSILSLDNLCTLIQLATKPILTNQEDNHTHKSLIAGALCTFNDNNKREQVITEASSKFSDDDTVKLLMLAPFGKGTWNLVDKLDTAAQDKYWDEVAPDWIHNPEEDNRESVDRLMKARRPRAAFSCIRLHPEKISEETLFQVLTEVAKGGNDKPGQYMLEHYSVEKTFEHLNASSKLTLEKKTELEFSYLEILSRPWGSHGGNSIPNLERYVEAHPEFFVQAIVWTYKRSDGATDPIDLQVPQDNISNLAERGYKLLEALERIPGHDDLGELQTERLEKWISTVRKSCMELSRADIADVCIGKLLSSASVGEDGVWPCKVVRHVMENIQSEPMMRGAHTGVYNSRGVTTRMPGEGGSQERDIAAKYRKWGEAILTTHPFVATNLLLELADTYEREAMHHDNDANVRRRLT
ncbi:MULTISPECIES: HigA family addiction module antitoxin [Cobetia]|uniref:HigA family addiction module antitoxin n=1 Tax=Cobetia TaxID=204286 RepID=UPI00158278C5|nr:MULTISPECIES: HigA family addiction module antitoxin [Cobetia]MDI4662641.1 HigA family addiction module antitoxin [Cobetia sp. BMC6]NUJ57898.1 HigA family addiction module antidote protein [Cobetia marina]